MRYATIAAALAVCLGAVHCGGKIDPLSEGAAPDEVEHSASASTTTEGTTLTAVSEGSTASRLGVTTWATAESSEFVTRTSLRATTYTFVSTTPRTSATTYHTSSTYGTWATSSASAWSASASSAAWTSTGASASAASGSGSVGECPPLPNVVEICGGGEIVYPTYVFDNGQCFVFFPCP